MLIDIAARSNSVVPEHNPAPPRTDHATLSVGNRVTVTLYRGTGPISAIAASGRRQSDRPRVPTTVLVL